MADDSITPVSPRQRQLFDALESIGHQRGVNDQAQLQRVTAACSNLKSFVGAVSALLWLIQLELEQLADLTDCSAEEVQRQIVGDLEPLASSPHGARYMGRAMQLVESHRLQDPETTTAVIRAVDESGSSTQWAGLYGGLLQVAHVATDRVASAAELSRTQLTNRLRTAVKQGAPSN
ncbi:MAG: hypothetical protein M3072_05435 [Candidatus Dormibacteraeota bacterium]|nr:hypothetical protein [Candidatus Dormibacteraeota bacterium]